MDPSEGAGICPERRARSFTTIAVNFTAAITIVSPARLRTLWHTMASALAGLFKDGVGQERIIAVTRAATVGRKVAMLPEESAFGAVAVRACEPTRMEVRLHPNEADTVIQQFGDREIHHIGLVLHHA